MVHGPGVMELVSGKHCVTSQDSKAELRAAPQPSCKARFPRHQPASQTASQESPGTETHSSTVRDSR